MPDQYDANGQLIQPDAGASELTADALHATLFVDPAAPVVTLTADAVTITSGASVTIAGPVAADEPAMVGVVSEAIFDKLKTILGVLGHELPVFFDEAVALAKKAL